MWMLIGLIVIVGALAAGAWVVVMRMVGSMSREAARDRVVSEAVRAGLVVEDVASCDDGGHPFSKVRFVLGPTVVVGGMTVQGTWHFRVRVRNAWAVVQDVWARVDMSPFGAHAIAWKPGLAAVAGATAAVDAEAEGFFAAEVSPVVKL